MSSGDHDDVTYRVAVNHEEQYSVWPADRDPPAGWRATDMAGSKTECLSLIAEVWTDMRPLSVRRALDQHGTHDGIPAQPDS